MEVILIVIAIILIIINKIYVKNYKAIRNFIYRIEIKKTGSELYREIDAKYSPSVVSYLYNQKIEPEKDLVADILNLYARKIIDIIDSGNNQNVLRLNEEIYKDKYFKNELFENDRYIIDTIVSRRFNFNYEEWVQKTIRVYREKLNIKESNKKDYTDFEEYLQDKKKKEMKELKVYVGIPLLAIALFMVLAWILKKDIAAAMAIGTAISFLSLFLIILLTKISNRDENKDMHLTKKAKEELKKYIRLEKFIKENTLLKDKKFEEIILYEQYIPFAMVLDINKKYKKEMIKIVDKKEIKLIMDSIKKYKSTNNVFTELNRNDE